MASDANSKPRVLLSILKAHQFDYEADSLCTAITAGFGRFECEKLLKPSGVELLNLPRSAHIDITVLRRSPVGGHKDPLYQSLVPISTVMPASHEQLASLREPQVWEGWIGMQAAGGIKGQSTEATFRQAMELGTSTARVPRLYVRLQYLAPGISANRGPKEGGSKDNPYGSGVHSMSAVPRGGPGLAPELARDQQQQQMAQSQAAGQPTAQKNLRPLGGQSSPVVGGSLPSTALGMTPPPLANSALAQRPEDSPRSAAAQASARLAGLGGPTIAGRAATPKLSRQISKDRDTNPLFAASPATAQNVSPLRQMPNPLFAASSASVRNASPPLAHAASARRPGAGDITPQREHPRGHSPSPQQQQQQQQQQAQEQVPFGWTDKGCADRRVAQSPTPAVHSFLMRTPNGDEKQQQAQMSVYSSRGMGNSGGALSVLPRSSAGGGGTAPRTGGLEPVASFTPPVVDTQAQVPTTSPTALPALPAGQTLAPTTQVSLDNDGIDWRRRCTELAAEMDRKEAYWAQQRTELGTALAAAEQKAIVSNDSIERPAAAMSRQSSNSEEKDRELTQLRADILQRDAQAVQSSREHAETTVTLRAQLGALQSDLNKHETAANSMGEDENQFFQEVGPLLARLGQPAVPSPTEDASNRAARFAAVRFGLSEAGAAAASAGAAQKMRLQTLLSLTESALNSAMSFQEEQAFSKWLESDSNGIDATKQLGSVAPSLLDCCRRVAKHASSVQHSAVAATDGTAGVGLVYKADKEDPVDCMLAAKLLRLGVQGAHVARNFVRVGPGVYQINGRQRVACRIDSSGRMVVRRPFRGAGHGSCEAAALASALVPARRGFGANDDDADYDEPSLQEPELEEVDLGAFVQEMAVAAK